MKKKQTSPLSFGRYCLDCSFVDYFHLEWKIILTASFGLDWYVIWTASFGLDWYVIWTVPQTDSKDFEATCKGRCSS